ncbi:MAG TPA: hypothetical protein VL202_06665 [Pararhizobium sp.]|nr:hypothetical protein [Pararhizobium sp.]HTO30841.1 hypothetical protein [Pararhizobium sp.]
MNVDSKNPSEATRSTIPQHILDRFESEWHQMRSSAAAAPKSFQREDDKR